MIQLADASFTVTDTGLQGGPKHMPLPTYKKIVVNRAKVCQLD